MSLSSTAPTLPSGYTYSDRVGAVLINSSGYLIRTLQHANQVQYIVDGTILTHLPLITSGASGTYSSSTFTGTSISVAAFVPSTASAIYLQLASPANNYTTLGVAPNGNYTGGYNSTSNSPLLNNLFSGSGGVSNEFGALQLESTSIYYAAAGSGSYLFCSGWNDNL